MSALAKMSRADRRAAARYMSQESAKWPTTLKEWPRDDWPKPNPNILRVWRSSQFLVQEHPAPAPAIVRLSILRSNGLKSDGGWQEDITWVELQRLKREAGYGDHDAVEVFPPDDDLVNVANIRHLWVLEPKSLLFAWRLKP